jgi:protease-4
MSKRKGNVMDEINNIEFTAPGEGETETINTMFAAQPKKSHKKLIITVIIIAAILLVIFISAAIASGSRSTDANYGGGSPYIGVLYIEGEITSSASSSETYQQSWLLKQIEYMMSDKSNKGIMLYVNSPGGSVYPTDEMYLKLMEYKENTGRPLYAYFAETAASGAYYMSAAADKITANRNCTTGSIGVYLGPIIDASGLLDRLGVDVEIIKSAENKAMGNSYEPLTDEQRAIYQEYVNECYSQFVDVVAKGRNMNEETVRQIADGRIYTASQALANGLIDEVSSFKDAKYTMLKEKELNGCDFRSVRYEPKKSLYNLLAEKTENTEPATELELALDLVENGSATEVKYLMS